MFNQIVSSPKLGKKFGVILPTTEEVRKYLPDIEYPVWVRRKTQDGFGYAVFEAGQLFWPTSRNVEAAMHVMFVPITDDGAVDSSYLGAYRKMCSGSTVSLGSWSPYHVPSNNTGYSTLAHYVLNFSGIIVTDNKQHPACTCVVTSIGFLTEGYVMGINYATLLNYNPAEDGAHVSCMPGTVIEIDGEKLRVTAADYISDLAYFDNFLIHRLAKTDAMTPGGMTFASVLPHGVSKESSLLPIARNPDGIINLDAFYEHKILYAPMLLPCSGIGAPELEGEVFPCCSLYLRNEQGQACPVALKSLPKPVELFVSGAARFGPPDEQPEYQISGVWRRGKLYLLSPVFYGVGGIAAMTAAINGGVYDARNRR